MQKSQIPTKFQRKIIKMMAKDSYGRGHIDLTIEQMAAKYQCHLLTIKRILRFLRKNDLIQEIRNGAYEFIRIIKKPIMEFLNNPYEWLKNKIQIPSPDTLSDTLSPKENCQGIHIEQENEEFVNVSVSPKQERKKDLKKTEQFHNLLKSLGNVAYSLDHHALNKVCRLSQAEVVRVIERYKWKEREQRGKINNPSAMITEICLNLPNEIQKPKEKEEVKPTMQAEQPKDEPKENIIVREIFALSRKMLNTLKTGWNIIIEDSMIICQTPMANVNVPFDESGLTYLKRIEERCSLNA